MAVSVIVGRSNAVPTAVVTPACAAATDTLPRASTSSIVDPVELPGSTSPPAVATMVTGPKPGCSPRSRTVTVGSAFAGSTPKAHTYSAPAGEQLPWEGVAATMVAGAAELTRAVADATDCVAVTRLNT